MSDRQDSVEDGAATPGAESSRRRQPRRRPTRVRAACLRCQKRKIKCDGNVPSCSACSKVGAECLEHIRSSGRDFEAYVHSLLNRIEWLESNLRVHCPAFDLNDGPQIILQGGNIPRNTESITMTMNWTATNTAATQSQRLPGIPSERSNHEISLVPVTAGQDLRYVGPSSGYTFANLLIASIGRHNNTQTLHTSFSQSSHMTSDAFKVPPADIPSTIEHTQQLSLAYWEHIHWQYPFLHQPTHTSLIELADPNVRPAVSFQILMVLAISTTILSRRMRVQLCAEGYCAKAMTYFDKVTIEGSIEGLQCLLLLQMYAMHNPSSGLNSWYLNYQCIACVLDLGLQREVKAGRNVSILDQEMRTRIFWVVHTLDRTLGTILGRPIGLRDEACDLRFPADMDDGTLMTRVPSTRLSADPATSITCAIHMFKLSLLNSEIKYIANSISHKTPAYTYPQIPDILAWQSGILTKLQQWATTIPRLNDIQFKTSEIKCHEIIMLLLRPSPAIPSPSRESLKLCHESTIAVLHRYGQLYREENLLLSWQTLHSVFLTTITMLYCIWKVPGIAASITVSALIKDVRSASTILSALAEHFSEARRGRDLIDELSSATIEWMMCRNENTLVQVSNMNSSLVSNLSSTVGHFVQREVVESAQALQNQLDLAISTSDCLNIDDGNWDLFFGIPDEMMFSVETENLLQDVFGDFQAGI